MNGDYQLWLDQLLPGAEVSVIVQNFDRERKRAQVGAVSNVDISPCQVDRTPGGVLVSARLYSIDGEAGTAVVEVKQGGGRSRLIEVTLRCLRQPKHRHLWRV